MRVRMLAVICGRGAVGAGGALNGCATWTAADPGVEARAATLMKSSFKARGQAGLDRLDQDETQKLCSEYANRSLPVPIAEKIQQANLATIRYPADGKLVGDWKNGEKIAQEGRGKQFSDDPQGELLCLPSADAGRGLVRDDRSIALPVRQDARFHRRNAPLRVGQGVQRGGVRRVLEHAALRSQRDPDRGADPGRRRAAGRSRVAGQSVTIAHRAATRRAMRPA